MEGLAGMDGLEGLDDCEGPGCVSTGGVAEAGGVTAGCAFSIAGSRQTDAAVSHGRMGRFFFK